MAACVPVPLPQPVSGCHFAALRLTSCLLHPPWMPALAAAMASWLGMPCLATAEEQNTMEPPPVPIIFLTADLVNCKHSQVVFVAVSVRVFET